ncbi:unnamed protein product [Closterium sp. Naga37s-1]|nr:unnamed protein product [Closterium sp. Naga37s-1]
MQAAAGKRARGKEAGRGEEGGGGEKGREEEGGGGEGGRGEEAAQFMQDAGEGRQSGEGGGKQQEEGGTEQQEEVLWTAESEAMYLPFGAAPRMCIGARCDSSRRSTKGEGEGGTEQQEEVLRTAESEAMYLPFGAGPRMCIGEGGGKQQEEGGTEQQEEVLWTAESEAMYLPFGAAPRMCIGARCDSSRRSTKGEGEGGTEQQEEVLRTAESEAMYLPFGAGPRMCIGARFALMGIKLCLVLLLRVFDISSATDANALKLLNTSNTGVKGKGRGIQGGSEEAEEGTRQGPGMQQPSASTTAMPLYKAGNAATERIHDGDALSRSIIDGFLDDLTLIDFSFPDHLCGTWHHNYTRMHHQIRAASKNPSGDPPPDAPPVKFLTFDGLSHCDSLGETLMGLTSAFTVALLTNRAFVMKHPCIPMAFEPALIDWQPTEDVGFEPVRNETFPLDPPNREVKPPIGATDIVEINLELHPEAHPEKVFPQVEAARNLRVVWNKDLLVHMLKGANESVWGGRLKDMGVSIPYAFGCFVRYLLRPKPEVWHRMQPFEKQLRGDKVVSIGLHVRHFGRGPLPPNTTISSGELRRAMNDIVWPAIKCAKDVENWWYPPFLKVKWLVISDSLQLKQKAAIVNESKIMITEFDPWVPPSLLNISQSPPPAPAPSSDPSSDPTTTTTTTTTATPEGSPLSDIPSVQTFQETSRAIIDAFPDVPTLIDFGFPDHLCGTWHHNYTRMHQQIRAASKNPSSAPPPDTPPVKFLTFDGLSHCDSLGETLMGLTSAFTVALLTNRAFVIKHPCIPMAFEPAMIDWQPTEDVGFEPVRNETFPLDPPDRAVTPPIGASDIVEINLEMHPEAHPEKVFPKVEAARNLRVVWNKDLLVHMLKGANESVWGGRLRSMGVRIPYAFGCFIRYLLRPKPEVWHRMQPFEKQLRGDKVVSIGMHVRQFGRGPPPSNTTISPEEVKQVMDDVVWPAIECAKPGGSEASHGRRRVARH